MATYSNGTAAGVIVSDLASQIKGKTVLITGASPGSLGAYFAEAIAKASPKLLILTGRSASKIEATCKAVADINPEVKTRILLLDTASFKSVRSAASEVNAYHESVDVLVNNAGMVSEDYQKTEDGFEYTWQANHLGPFLFTNLIIDKVLAGHDSGRVVNISSDAHALGFVRYFDYNFHDGESFTPFVAYGQSKTANVLFARALAQKLAARGLQAFSLHPGFIWTNAAAGASEELFGSVAPWAKKLGSPLGWAEFEQLSPEQGVAMHTFVSFSPDIKEHNGKFFCNFFEKAPTPDDDLASWVVGEIEIRKCWELSEKLVGQKFDY